MSLPSVDQVRALHEKYAPTVDAFQLVNTHCEIVWNLACEIINRAELDLDTELVKIGCLIHDIGVYKLYDTKGNLDERNYVQHGILGHEILRNEGFPETICRFCSCHTGVGLTRSDVIRQQLPLPSQDYIAETPEELVVMYADKFHSKATPPKFMTATAYANYVKRFGHDKIEKFDAMRAAFGDPDVTALAARYGHRLEKN
ncbi:HD domain-containing protein [Streptomyces sp. NPDC002845]